MIIEDLASDIMRSWSDSSKLKDQLIIFENKINMQKSSYNDLLKDKMLVQQQLDAKFKYIEELNVLNDEA